MGLDVKESSDRQRIWDDSHAHAILKQEFYTAEQRFDAGMRKMKRQLPRSRVKRFRRIAAALGTSLKPCLLDSYYGPLPSHGKRDCYRFISLERFSHSVEQREQFKSQKVVPCSLTDLDPKGLSVWGCHASCLVTEHALERLIRRSQCYSFPEIIEVAQRYLLTIMKQEACGALQNFDEFIVVGPDGYMPCRRSEEDSMPLVLTWIPRAFWSPQQEAKLTQLADHCKEQGEMKVLGHDAFNGSYFIDPAIH